MDKLKKLNRLKFFLETELNTNRIFSFMSREFKITLEEFEELQKEIKEELLKGLVEEQNKALLEQILIIKRSQNKLIQYAEDLEEAEETVKASSVIKSLIDSTKTFKDLLTSQEEEIKGGNTFSVYIEGLEDE